MFKWYVLLDGWNVQVVELSAAFVRSAFASCDVVGPFNFREEARTMARIARRAQEAVCRYMNKEVV